MDFFEQNWVKIVTFSLPVLAFIISFFAQKIIEKELPEKIKKHYKKLAMDALVKTILMFAGAILVAIISIINSDNWTLALTKSTFTLTLLTGVSCIWLNRKNSNCLNEAKEISIEGNRKRKIQEIETIHTEKVIKNTNYSLFFGLIGVIYINFFYHSYPINIAWFLSVLSTGPAIAASRWGDAVSISASKYASDKNFGI
jgi:hypothetical protein